MDVYELLIKNPNKSFSAAEASDVLGVNLTTTRKLLTKLVDKKEVTVKTILGNSSAPLKIYKIIITDDYFEEALHQYESTTVESRFVHMNKDHLLQLLVIKELKKIHEVVKNGCNKHV